MDATELKEFLDFKVKQYNSPAFIESDPILENPRKLTP
jgi:hypothetical protein